MGAILDFCKHTLSCSYIDSGVMHLRQMMAGHFLIELLPPSASSWGAPPRNRGQWRSCGQDGVLELMMTRPQWVQYKLQVVPSRSQHDREHLLVESSLRACHFESLDMCRNSPSTLTSARAPLKRRHRRRCGSSHGPRVLPEGCRMLEAMAPSIGRQKSLARQRSSPLAAAALLLALLASAVSQCWHLQGLATAGGVHAGSEVLAGEALALWHRQDERFASFGMPVVARSFWISHGLPGGSHGWRDVAPQWTSRTTFTRKPCDVPRSKPSRRSRRARRWSSSGSWLGLGVACHP